MLLETLGGLGIKPFVGGALSGPDVMHAGGSGNITGGLPVVETSLIVTSSLCRTGTFEICFEEELELFPVKEFSIFQEC